MLCLWMNLCALWKLVCLCNVCFAMLICANIIDKVTVDIRAKRDGVLVETLAAAGEEIAIGAPLYKVGAGVGKVATKAAPTPAVPAAPAQAAKVAPVAAPAPVKAAPSAGVKVTAPTVAPVV